MENLTFGEQVKIILSRKGMTIKELAEKIESITGKKMSRQNLTQRLGRDNFQERDMRMIATILGCSFQLSIMASAEDAIQASMIPTKLPTEAEIEKLEYKKKLREEKQSQVKTKEYSDGTKESVVEEKPKPEPRKQVYIVAGTPKKEVEAEERDMTIGEVFELHEELSELESSKREEKAADLLSGAEADMEEEQKQVLDETEAEELEEAEAEELDETEAEELNETEAEGLEELEAEELEESETEGQSRTEPAVIENQEVVTKESEVPDMEEIEDAGDAAVKADSGATISDAAAFYEPFQSHTPIDVHGVQETPIYDKKKPNKPGDDDFEPVISHDDLPEDRERGEVNPYSGKEYQTNSVRMHPNRIGYVQVYDRADHKWTDMTEWAFLGYQERKKALLGKEYDPPIYLD
ncbi:MAG: hypothetical protein PHN80_02935 [Hespellia sp.]|nr:hypothetical protein [Hespellia sp.]